MLIVAGRLARRSGARVGRAEPNIVGSEIGLHPVWLIFALLTFSYLFGFLGLLVAVPVSAAIGVLVRFALRTYLAVIRLSGRRRERRRISLDTPHDRRSPEQLVFELPHRPRSGVEDFLVSEFERRRRRARRSLARLAGRRRRDCRPEGQRQNPSRQRLAAKRAARHGVRCLTDLARGVPAIASAGALHYRRRRRISPTRRRCFIS